MKICFTLILMLCMMSCLQLNENNPPPKKDISGKIVKGVYTNDYFGFKLKIPNTWRVIPKSEYSERNKKEREKLEPKVGDFNDFDTNYDAVIAFEKRHEIDSMYSNILFLKENITSLAPTAREYLEMGEKFIYENSLTKYPKFEFGTIRENKTIGGLRFVAQPIFIWSDEEKCSKKVNYCRKFGDSFLLIQIAHFQAKEELSQAQHFLDTIEWEKQPDR